MSDAPVRRFGRRWGVALIAVPWLAMTGLLIAGGGDLEGLLRSTFGDRARPDAFNYLNGMAHMAWVVSTVFVLLAIAAAWRRRYEVVLILLIGGWGLPLVLCLAFEDWSDPNWHDVAGVGMFSQLVSTVVGGCCWCLVRRGPAPPESTTEAAPEPACRLPDIL